VPAGLLLVAAVDLGPAADRLPVGDLGGLGDDGDPELPLQSLGDDRDVGLAHGEEDLFAGLAPLDPGRRLLLEHPGDGRTHLVEVGLRLWLDGDPQGRCRELEGREAVRALSGREGVSDLGDGELRDGADLAGPELPDGLLVFAVEDEEGADPLVLAPIGVVDGRLGVEGPREDPQVGQPADEGVGARLEGPDEERAGRIALETDRRPRSGVDGRHGWEFGRGRQVADDGLEEAADPDPLRRTRDEDRGEDPVADTPVEAGVELLVADLLALEVLG